MKLHSLIRLFVDQPLSQGAIVTLSANNLHYLKNVMRKKIADNFMVFNGRDGEYRVEITLLEKKHGEVIILEQTRKQEEEPNIWLVFAPIKHGKIDNMVQNATQLGVANFWPMITSRTNIDKVRSERLMANMIEAAEQCERLTVPTLQQAGKLPDIINQWPGDRKIILCDETGSGESAGDLLAKLSKDDKYAIFIGPEGGFTKDELDSLRKLSCVTSIGLGPRILKAETAAIAAVTLWQSYLGDWSKMPDFRS